MPKSCKCILDTMVHKGAMSEADRDKILRNIKTEWIPVTERLPKEKLAVLVWCPQRKNIYCAYYDKRNANKVVYHEWFIFGAFNTIIDEDVVAWTPLPEEPYEGSAE